MDLLQGTLINKGRFSSSLSFRLDHTLNSVIRLYAWVKDPLRLVAWDYPQISFGNPGTSHHFNVKNEIAPIFCTKIKGLIQYRPVRTFSCCPEFKNKEKS